MSNLQLAPFQFNPEYCSEWGVHNNDFVVLVRDGERINDSVYRTGMFKPKLDGGYFMLLKYTEAYYSEDIMRCSNDSDPKHLEGRWCILDPNGVEKKTFKGMLDNPYLVDNSRIYSLDSKYYNVETDEFYCYASDSFSSNEFLFLHNNFDNDKSRRGVMKIRKSDGTFELFPE